jgi:hypothetical protein
MRWRFAALLAVAACGRVGFTPSQDASQGEGGPDAALLTGLLGWWQLDETSGTVAHDSAGSDNGTLIGALSFENEAIADGSMNTVKHRLQRCWPRQLPRFDL